MSENSIITQKATILNRPYLQSYWKLNDNLRLKNEKLLKQQQLSCRIVFYSLWLCIIAGVMCIVIYRFIDECPLTTNRKEFFLKCLKYWFFFAAICISIFSCSGVIFGAYRYCRSQSPTLLSSNEEELRVLNNHNLLPMTSALNTYDYSTSLVNINSIIPSKQIQNRDDEHSNNTLISFITNTSSQRKIPPFNYDELPSEPNPIRILKSSNNKYYSIPNSIMSSPHMIFSTTAIKDSNTINTNSDQNEVDIWEKQEKSSL